MNKLPSLTQAFSYFLLSNRPRQLGESEEFLHPFFPQFP